ncbi:MAG TPA: penicillin-binding protein [Terriglobales bacterium]|nr:penicillin-binding protein [Terriglobales bacterium]
MAGGWNSNGNGVPRRLLLLALFLFLWASLIGLRLVDLQILQYGELLERAQRQQQRTIEVSPRRGVIYDRNGQELAMSVTVDSVFAVPSEIPDQETAAQLLARVLETDTGDIHAKLKSSRAFAWIARKVDAQTSQRIRALNLRGIYFQKESKRFYPKRDLAAQALGYVGMDDEGLGGIEYAFDKELRGGPGRMMISLDARRRWFGRVEREPSPGQNVVLTLDEKIQYIAERELDEAMRQTRSAAGTIIVQNPHTGEILALASRPTFNPNTFRKSSPEALKNRAVSDVYEPGSTFKIVTIAGALEEKLTRPSETIDCQNGAIYLGSFRIRDHKPFGLLSVADVLAHSSDVGTIKLGLRLGEERFDQYIHRFGFGQPTGIELPGESRGLTKPVSRWSKVSIGAISMGQEIGITGLQLVALVSTIANDGVWTAARIVAGVTREKDGLQRVLFQPAEQRRAISPETAIQMKRMMEGVVLHGTGRRAILEGYTAAGKTGTAQKIDPSTRTYSSWKHVASFVGFAPVNQPAVTVAVILDSPLGPHQGGQVAAPVFARVTQQVLAYLRVPHDIDVPRQQLLLRAAASVADDDVSEGSPDHPAWSAEPPEAGSTAAASLAPEAAETAPRTHLVATTAKPASQPDAAPPPLQAPSFPGPPANGTVMLDTEGGVVVPSLIGKPLREALVVAQRAGIELDVVGSGVAREQAPPPGSRIPAGARVAVRFAR